MKRKLCGTSNSMEMTMLVKMVKTFQCKILSPIFKPQNYTPNKGLATNIGILSMKAPPNRKCSVHGIMETDSLNRP